NQQKFDLIVFNPPDFPSIIQKSHRGDYVEKFVDGGKDGREHLDQVIKKAHLYLNKNGRIQLVQSYVSNVEKTVKLLEKNGLKVKITATKIEPFGRTGRERIDYFKKLGIKIIYHSDIPMEKLCIVTAYKNKI
ncbi:hypothetical protein MUP35_03725, partial [Patescibacteria group bacterium]|nr:hypothetical protein [Patescibacteria group bacterium]